MRFEALERALGHSFASPELLQQALTHRSFGTPNNERLEFIGDAVLNCVVALALFQRFPALKEGELSRLRASLVRQETLHGLAQQLDLGSYLRLGEGELRSGGHSRPSILADAFEAVLAAIHLDAGFDAARQIIDRLFEPLLAALDADAVLKDPKTALQEWLQARKKPLPRYEMVTISGEAHAQTFEVECAIDAFALRTRGSGSSRRAAEQQAAEAALTHLKQFEHKKPRTR